VLILSIVKAASPTGSGVSGNGGNAHGSQERNDGCGCNDAGDRRGPRLSQGKTRLHHGAPQHGPKGVRGHDHRGRWISHTQG